MSLPGRLWLPGLAHRASPNADDRPPESAVDLLVIHGISLPPGQFGGRFIDDLFLNRLAPDTHPYFEAIADLRVSTHVLIRRNGDAVQFVALERRAWHAGASCFDGRERCNDFSIGIELEGCDDRAYTEPQYLRLAHLTRQIRQHFPAIGDRIVGHSDIAPERKTDPGPAFDWQHYRQLLGQAVAGEGATRG